MVYKARKQTSKYRIKLDLTRKRRDLIKKANESLVRENESFVFGLGRVNSSILMICRNLRN